MGRWSHRIVSSHAGPQRGSATELDTFAVTAVHPGSPAAEAGLTAGLLYRPSRAGVLSPLLLPERRETGTVTSLFVDSARGEEIEIVSVGFPFGVELCKSPASLAADVFEGAFDIDALADLVHGGDAEAIGRFVDLVATHQRKMNRGLGDVLKTILAGVSAAKPEASASLNAENYMGLMPHAKLVGAFWLAAHKHPREARRLLQAWEHWGVDSSGGAFAGLYYLTLALLKESEGVAGADVKDLLRKAHSLAEPSVLIETFWKDRADEALSRRNIRTGTAFPRDYRLAEMESRAPQAGLSTYMSLGDARDGLNPEQRVLVLLLGSYRANGFYSRIMHRLSELQPLLGAFIPSVHVITSFEAGGRHDEEWMLGERLARTAGAHVHILHDQRGDVWQALGTSRSPHAYFIDRDGIIRYDGWLANEGGFWEALN
jgi:deoxyribose-phosphate aldolase